MGQEASTEKSSTDQVKVVRRRSEDNEPKINFLALKKEKIFVPLLARSNFAQRTGKEYELPTLDKQLAAGLMTHLRGHFGELRLAVDQNQGPIGDKIKEVEKRCEVLLRDVNQGNKDFEKVLNTLHNVKSVSDKVNQLVSSIDEAIVGSEMLRQLLEPEKRLPSFAVLYLNDKILEQKSRSLALATKRDNEQEAHKTNSGQRDRLIIQQIRNIQDATPPPSPMGERTDTDLEHRPTTIDRANATRSIINHRQASHMAFL